jgi:DNA-binding MarR family transcriptional regulator
MMLTDAITGVDGRPAGLVLTIADIARRKGVSKQAVSKRVARLEAIGALTTHPGPRGTVLVSLAEYDRAVGETSELAYAQAPAKPADAEHVYTREQAREKAYKADLAKLDLDERLGKLVAVEALASAAGAVAEAMVRAIDQMPGRADDLAAAVGKDGTTGARAALKTIARELRETLARELARLADIGQSNQAGRAPRADEDDA